VLLLKCLFIARAAGWGHAWGCELGHAAPRRPRLVVTHGHLRGQVIEVVQSDVIIGRHPDSDVVLASPYVSRSHLRVRQDDSGTWVTDLRTVGGTTVNGTRVHRPTLLHDGDEVCLGGITLVYEAGADPAVPAEPQATSRIPRPRRR
jgi:pSer/pThr/pTyr-binding forkhead associated (FHA) protein